MIGPRPGFSILAAVTTALFAPSAQAQCTPDWFAGAPYPGANGTVNASLIFDPDGPGPAQPLLIIAGEFTVAGDILAPHIAAFDGTTWTAPFGQGFDGPVRALTTYNGELIAAGEFAQADGQPASRIARWDGAHWQALAGGLDGPVYALAAHNGQLFAGGAFTHAEGAPAGALASWNGSAWSPTGTVGVDGSIYALASFNNKLYIGGDFLHADSLLVNAVASWDGATFADLAGGISVSAAYAPAEVRSLLVNGPYLYVGGMFETAGPIATDAVARWDGAAWSAAGAGLYYRTCVRYVCHNHPYRVAAMGLAGSNIYAATCYAAGGVPLMHVFNGASWTAAGTTTATAAAPWTVATITDYKGTVYMGGDFGGDNAPINLARLSGSQWTWPQGIGAAVQSMVPFNNGLVLGGAFTALDGIAANYVAFWDGNTFTPMGAGLGAPGHGLATDGTNLYASGWPGGIYQWNGSSWVVLYGAGAFGGPPSVGVYNNQVIAGTNSGAFGVVGEETDPSAIGIWNGASWAPLGTATSCSTGPCAFATFNGSLYAAGLFGSTSSAPVGRYNGTGWQALGSTTYGPGIAVAAHSGVIYASMGYDPGPWIIAQWVSNAWQQVGGDFDGPPTALASINGDLYAAGAFSTIGGNSIRGIARWDGAAWQPLGQGLDGPATILAPFNNAIAAAGDFASAGAHGFARFALFGCPPTPPCTADFNCDGDIGTDADIQSFFACLAGSCPAAPCTSTADFNHDGAVGTDQDIEAFFRVLAGGSC